MLVEFLLLKAGEQKQGADFNHTIFKAKISMGIQTENSVCLDRHAANLSEGFESTRGASSQHSGPV